MTDGQVNYEAYSDLELREALLSIDRQAFPHNYRNLTAIVAARALQSGTSGSPYAESPSPETAPGVAPKILEFEELIVRLTPRTPVTYALIAVNVAVFAVMAWYGAGILDPDDRIHVAWGSNLVPLTVDGEWWRLGSSIFLHFGVIHLLLNMWVLHANGRMVERMFGSTRFLVLYLFAGLCGSLASAAWNPAVNSAGASGAIFGVLGGLAAFLVTKRSRVPREVIRAQRMSVGAFVFFNVANGIAHQGIDNAAHLGGLVGGFLIGLVLARPLTLESRGEPGATRVIGAVVAASFFLLLSGMFVQYVRGRHSPEERYAAAAVWFENREPQILATYNDLVERAQRAELEDGEFANRIGGDVLPFYSEAKLRLVWDPVSAGPFDNVRRSLNRYAELREKSMSMLADALRMRDKEMVDAAMQVQRESDLLVQELNAAAEADAAAAAAAP
jgi:membrane associated rhomboid family serine protease